MRPAGGYTPDMINFALSTDVYQIWADMVTRDERILPQSVDSHWCAAAGRREDRNYRHSEAEIFSRWEGRFALCERVPERFRNDPGVHIVYAIHAWSEQEVREFIDFVRE